MPFHGWPLTKEVACGHLLPWTPHAVHLWKGKDKLLAEMGHKWDERSDGTVVSALAIQSRTIGRRVTSLPPAWTCYFLR
jgi:hypothetical protein